MNVEPVLLALQAAFLILLYVFIWRVVRSAGRDMQVAPQERDAFHARLVELGYPYHDETHNPAYEFYLAGR